MAACHHQAHLQQRQQRQQGRAGDVGGGGHLGDDAQLQQAVGILHGGALGQCIQADGLDLGAQRGDQGGDFLQVLRHRQCGLQLAQRRQAQVQRAGELAGRIEGFDAHVHQPCAFGGSMGAGQSGLQPGVHALGPARQVGHARRMHVQAELGCVVALPGAITREGQRMLGQRRGEVERGGVACPARRHQVQAGQVLALPRGLHQHRALVQVVHHVERRALRVDAFAQQPADAQMQRGPLRRIGQAVGGFLHAVVRERQRHAQAGTLPGLQHRDPLVVGVQRQQQARLQRRQQIGQRGIFGQATGGGQRPQLETPAQAGGRGQQCLRGRGQALQLAGHQRGHVVGQPLGRDGVQRPAPARGVAVQPEQAALCQVFQEAAQEERVAAGLGLAQLRQRLRLVDRAVHGVGDQLAGVRRCQRTDFELQDLVLAERGEKGQVLRQRMVGRHLGGAVGADQQQMAQALVLHHLAQQAARGTVGPLQVVDEQHQRCLGTGQRRAAQQHGAHEAVLGLGRPQRQQRRRRAQQQGQVGHGFGHHGGVAGQRGVQGRAPLRAGGVGQSQDLAAALLQGGEEWRAGCMAAVLVALAFDEMAAQSEQRALHLAH